MIPAFLALAFVPLPYILFKYGSALQRKMQVRSRSGKDQLARHSGHQREKVENDNGRDVGANVE